MMKHELGLPSHSVIYNNMINLHWKLGQHKIVTELFEVMKEEGCASDGYPPFTLVSCRAMLLWEIFMARNKS